jgi:hypothetical protein
MDPDLDAAIMVVHDPRRLFLAQAAYHSVSLLIGRHTDAAATLALWA